MDPNLLYWKNQGQSFLSRVRIWFNLLDPTVLLFPGAEIETSHSRLGAGEKSEKDGPPLTLALASVHADPGAVLPLVFSPPALLPVSAPLVLGSFIPHSTVKPALFWQFLLQSYYAGFNHTNRSSSSEQGKRMSMTQLLLIVGTVSYSTYAGALPQILIKQLRIRTPPVQTLYRFILPIPLSAVLAFFSVSTVRNEERKTGIQVFDSNGNPVGISKAAGEKAVRETGLSRAALFGTTAAVPNLLVLCGIKVFQRSSPLVAPLRHMGVAFVLSLMVPVSFSLFPQLGTIKREELEKELQAVAVDGQLFYHRGV